MASYTRWSLSIPHWQIIRLISPGPMYHRSCSRRISDYLHPLHPLSFLIPSFLPALSLPPGRRLVSSLDKRQPARQIIERSLIICSKTILSGFFCRFFPFSAILIFSRLHGSDVLVDWHNDKQPGRQLTDPIQGFVPFLA